MLAHKKSLGRLLAFLLILKVSKLFSVMEMVTGSFCLFATLAKFTFSFGCSHSVVHFGLSLDVAQHCLACLKQDEL